MPAIHSFNVGVEAEAAGRVANKSFVTLRRDLAALPWVLATPDDIVLAPKQRPEFLASLHAAGVHDLPRFQPKEVPLLQGEESWESRPWGVAGQHLARSNVAQYKPDQVSVCRSFEEVQAAVSLHGPGRVVLKAEYSSSGLGLMLCDALESLETGARCEGHDVRGWVGNGLKRDGVVSVEPYLEVIAEFSGEWLRGEWRSVSHHISENRRWTAQYIGEPLAVLTPEVYRFVYVDKAVERALLVLDVPGTCGSATCGMDVAVVRGAEGELEVSGFSSKDIDIPPISHTDLTQTPLPRTCSLSQ